MNEKEEEYGIIRINKNKKNIITKNKIKLPKTISQITNKNIKINTNSNSIKNSYKKYNFYKIILNNIKKYNYNEYKYNLRIINNLILHKKNHFISLLQEKINFYYIKEFLKKYYIEKDIIKKFPKFNLYYKNYFKFFLKPTLTDFYFCDIINKNSNKHASVFYDKNKNKIKKKQNNIKNNFKSIFTKAQKMEIQNIINNSRYKKSINNNNENKNFEKNENKTLSTIIFSYESLNNSKNDNNIKINSSNEEISNSLVSITNLIKQSNLIKNKEKNEKNGKNFFKNKINLFLNLEEKTITQKSTLLSSTRSKKYETIKENANISNENKFYDFINKNNTNKIIKEKTNKNNKISNIKNNIENEFDIYLNCKNNNRNISLQKKSKSYRIYQKSLKDQNSKAKIRNEKIIIPTKNNFIKRNYTSENNNIYSTKKIPNELFLKSISNSINNINSFRNTTSLYTLTNNNIYNQIIQIIKHNKYNKNNYRNPKNFKNIYSSTTQITKINKKKKISRNFSIDLVRSQKDNIHRNNNIFFSSENQMNKLEKINKNNNKYLNTNIFYNNYKLDKNNKFPINILNYINNDNNGEIININNFEKYKLYNSSKEKNKIKLNKLIKELEHFNSLKNNKQKNDDKDKLKVYEYKNKN